MINDKATYQYAIHQLYIVFELAKSHAYPKKKTGNLIK